MTLSTSTLLQQPPLPAKPVQVVEALDDATLAELSSKHISRMTRPEMMRAVRAARIPAARRRLEYLDRPTLERLAYQARLCAQQRLH